MIELPQYGRTARAEGKSSAGPNSEERRKKRGSESVGDQKESKKSSEADETLPCEKVTLTVCAENDSENPICQMIQSDKPESSESIAKFIQKIEDLEPQTREDLLCARLFGAKLFEDIHLVPIWKATAPTVELGKEERLVENARFSGDFYIGTEERGSPAKDTPYFLWDIAFEDDTFQRIVENHIRLRNLESEGHMHGQFSVSFHGFVEKVELQYKSHDRIGVWLLAVKLTVSKAILSKISTTAGEGSPREVLKLSSDTLKAAYDEYMHR